ncbi:MAG: DUF2950 domain-containing protein [Luteolibacter sp.]
MKTLFNTLILSFLCLQHSIGAEATTETKPRVFETPQAAADVLITATKLGDDKSLVAVFGSKHQDLIGTVDAARDKELRAKFAKIATERCSYRTNGDGSVSLIVGFEAWPFPFPLVKSDAGWTFDTDAGMEELINRRVGENELAAIETLGAYVTAQRTYAAEPRDGTEVRQFARKLDSSPDKKDGLHWNADTAKGEEPSPGGPEIKDPKTPHDGYCFKILTAQGGAAPGGKYDYIINGHLIAGFAMVAWPAKYGETGVMTLIVNHYGDVYQKDLGEKTTELAAAMSQYNPDKTWTKTED